MISPGLGWVLLDQKDASASATLDFTNIPSGFDSYIFMFKNVVNATTANNFAFRCSTNNGSSYDSSGVYYITGYSMKSDVTSAVDMSGSSQTFGYLSGGASLASNPAHGVCGYLWCYDLTATTDKHFSSFTMFHDGTNFKSTIGSQVYSAAGAVNAMRFIMSAGGNITSGRIKLYGIR